MRRGLRAPTPSSALPTRARTAVRAPTFTPAKIPVVDTLKSRYASTSGEGGLNTLATFLFGMSSAKWEMPADAPRLSRESWDVTGSASPGQGPLAEARLWEGRLHVCRWQLSHRAQMCHDTLSVGDGDGGWGGDRP